MAERAPGRTRGFDLGVLAAAVAIGLAIAYVDSRPNWDDTGVTAFALLLSAGLLGFLAPRRPWLWGIAVGIGTMGSSVAHGGFSPIALLILAIPIAGSCGGAGARRFLGAPPSG